MRIQLDHATPREIVLQLKYALSTKRKVVITIVKKTDAKISQNLLKERLSLFPINPRRKFIGKRNIRVVDTHNNWVVECTNEIETFYISVEEINKRVGILITD